MNGLIEIQQMNGMDVVDSRLIAESLSIEHRALLQTISKHQEAIESSFGRVAFEMLPLQTNGGRQNATVAYLTEDQALFVGTLSRNTKKVVEFKTTLVKSFSEKRRQRELQAVSVAQPTRKEMALMILQVEEEKEALERELATARPKVEYVDEVLDTNDCVVTTVIASELGYSAMAFNKLLKERGIQWKVDGVWVLTSKYQGKGYAQMRTHTYHDSTGKRHTTMNMVWTQRGRAMLHYLFKQQPKQLPAAA